MRRRRGNWSLVLMLIVLVAATSVAGVGTRDSRGGGAGDEIVLSADTSVKSTRGRVINGKLVDDVTAKTRYPGLVALFDSRYAGSPNGGYFCGGTLVSATVVVTAAHCADFTAVASLRVLAGTTWLDQVDRARSQLIPASKLVKHPGWNKYDLQAGNDLAVITLSKPVPANIATPMLAVGPGEDNIWGAGRGITQDPARGPYLVGWGDTLEGVAKLMPKYPNDINMQVMPDSSCATFFGDEFTTANNMCAGGERTDDPVGSGGCNGDSGGPVVANANGAWRLVGVVSYGKATCDAKSPGAFVKVASYRAWLQQQGVPVGTGAVPTVFPAPAVTGRGYVVPPGAPVTVTEPADAASYDKLDALVPLRWTLRGDQRAQDIIVRKGATEVLRRSVAGLIGISMPLGGLPGGQYTWCVTSVDDFNAAPGGEACRSFTRVAAHNAGLTRASFFGRRATFTGQVVSSEPTVRVSVQVKAGRRLIGKKTIVVKLRGPGRVTTFSWKGALPKGVRPKALSSRVIVEGGGAKRGFNNVLR